MEPQKARNLRSSLRVDLVGTAVQLKRNRLPTNACILKGIVYEQKVNKVLINGAINRVTEIASSLNVPGVKPARKYHVKRRIVALHSEWKAIMKHKSRKTDHAKKIREEFLRNLPKSLDCFEVGDGTEEESTDQEEQNYEEEVVSQSEKSDERKVKINLVTPDVAMTLDRVKVSDRGASLILQSVGKGDHIKGDVKVSFMTIRRARIKARKMFADEIKRTFHPDVPLCLHWDGKILPNLQGKKEDRLAIVVTGDNISKLLAVPSVSDGKSETETQAIMDTVEDWDVQDRIVALSFDTTSVNTGIHNGVITRLPKLLERPLLTLACRHHTAELILKHTFELESNASRSDKLDDFRAFQAKYNANGFYLNPPSFRTVLDSSTNRAISEPWRRTVVDFCVSQLEKSHARGDYVELLELSIIFLGEVPPKGITFRKAGSLSRARWMARAIYALKAWIFQDSIKLYNTEMMTHLETMCFFITHCYVMYWYQVCSAEKAAQQDLLLWSRMDLFHNQKYADVGKKALCNHLWYLSERNVSMAFFDPDVPVSEKSRMLEKMTCPESPKKKRKTAADAVQVKADSIAGSMTLADFVTPRSLEFFQIMDINTDFMKKSPHLWADDESYQKAHARVSALQVVNDTAERAVKLISDFNLKLTNDPTQQQYLLQVVEFHRKNHPI